MDEMKLKLSTKFMRGIVAKIIAKALHKKFGYQIDILLNSVEIRADGDTVHLTANVEAEVTNEEFKKIIKSIGLD